MNIDPLLLFPALLAGIITSLLPGMHPNSIGAILNPLFGSENGWALALVAMLGVRMALQFLPSILIGVPEGDTQISLLPGQRMRKEGRGLEAIAVCAFSVVLAVAAALVLSPLIMPFMPATFAFVKPLTGWLLAVAVAALLLDEREARRICLAAVVFFLAGTLGAVTWNLPLLDPLFALFVGFFTMPALLHGERIGGEDKGLAQKTESLRIRPLLPYILLGVVLGGLADLLPGLSTPAQIAVFAALFVPLDEPARFLSLVAAIEASHTAFALTSSATVGVARVGVIAMVAQNSPIRPADLPALMGVFAFSVGAGALALLWIGKRVMKHWQKIDWTSLGRMLATYLVFVIFINDGWLGVLTLATATAIGMLPAAWGVRRTHVMGALILPAMLHAFGMI